MVAALQLDWMHARDEDYLPRVISWTIACAIGGAWLLVVYLTPVPVPSVPAPVQPGTALVFTPGLSITAAAAPAVVAPHGPGQTTHSQSPKMSGTALARAFTAGITEPLIAHIAQMIPGVTPAQGDVGTTAHVGKSAVATSADAAGTTPGLSSLGRESGAAAHVGQVAGGAAIAHTTVRVKPLPIVAAPPPGAAMADATAMGTFVRARVAQLETCYERAGGTDLAGVVALRLTIGDGGAVRSADIVRRTWSGPGAAAAEQCLIGIVRGWSIPSAPAGATVTIPISFTRGA